MALTMASVVITCALCYGIYYLIMRHLKRRRLYELASRLKGPELLPIIGNAYLFFGNGEAILSNTIEFLRSFPSPSRLWMGPLLVVFVTEPEHIKAVCLSPKTLEKSKWFNDFARPLFGTGILTAPVSKWQVHRKLIQSTFNTKILDSFVEIFATQANIFIEQMERNSNGEEFEIFRILSQCTLDMICETAMGIKVGVQTNENSHYLQALRGTLASLIERFFHFWLHPDFIFYRTKLGKDQRKYIKYLEDFVDNIIQIRRSEILQRDSQLGVADVDADEHDAPPRREAFLDLLMKLRDGNVKFSDRALRDEVMTMVLAANDTTALTNSYVMLMLASHPEVQEKVYQELYEIYGDTDSTERPVVAKDLSSMKYLERVIKETMRLLPAVPFTTRQVTDELDIGDSILPVGSTVIIGIMSLHRNKRHWPDPFKFNPDRFLPEETAKRHPYAYMPFSGGPRNCIGFNYGMMSMKTLLATVLRKYILRKTEIVPIDHIRLRLEIAMSPVDPITLSIQRRTNKNSVSDLDK